MTNLFKSGLFILELMHHELCEVDELVFIRAIAVEAVAPSIGLVMLSEGEGQSLDAEDDVLHRVVRKGLFGVLDVRVNDDEIIGFHGHLFVLDIEDAFPVEHVEKFGELMCMR